MRRIFAIGTLLSALCAFPAFAILDTNNNGLSDLWERAYNGGDLFPIDVFPYRPGDDSDGDGWTNEQEAAADTNPFDPNPPDGLIRPDIVHIPEVLGETPEAVTITWPTIVGKQYTLLYSPDLVEWLPVPDETFIGNGSVVSYNYTLDENTKLFWRVKIEDVDADSDGLTDAEEYELGTDPDNPETLTGYPDMWVAKHYTAALLNGALATLDLNGDPDGDGLINAQESVLGTDPNVADNPGIFQEAISNGDFSNPVIGTGVRAATTNPTWDYWEGGVSGWTAVVGSNIELQTVEPDDVSTQESQQTPLVNSSHQVSDASNGDYPYVELKAHPAGHYGIKQQVGTHIGTTYLLVFDCKARLNTTPSNNNFTVNIDGSVVKDITFDTIAPWTTKAVVFKATNCMTEISMVPTNSVDDTKGCFVDNVKLLPVNLRDISNNQVISNTAWIKAHKTDNSGDESEMPKLEARIVGLSNAIQVIWKLESRYSRRNGRDDLNVPFAGGDDFGVLTTGEQPWKIWEDIDFSTDPIFGGNETLKFKLIESSGVLVEGMLEFKIRGENPDDARCKAYIIANQGNIWYAWAIAKHESADSSGYYNQFANGLANDGVGAHGAKGEPFYAPSEGDGWGLFQRDSSSNIPVSTAETWSWDRNTLGFLHDEYPVHLGIANSYVDSVQNNNPDTFEEPQFTINGQVISGRHILALTWYNGRQGRSNSTMLHFDSTKPSGQRWSLGLPNAPKKNQPYVYEIMDQYNGG